MEKTIRHFREERESGLLLVDYPTGVGKTYNAISYMVKHRNDETIFFITPLKKNLFEAYEKLKKRINDDKWFDENVIYLKSNFDSLYDNILDITGDEEDILLEKESFKKLKNGIRLYTDNKNEALKEIIERDERSFRNDVEQYLKSFPSKKERLLQIKEKHHWLIDLYPGIESENKKIWFMTLDKFLSGNTTIISPTYKFIENSIINEATIFIDEIDSTKNRVLDFEIKNYLDYKLELFNIFKIAHANLHNHFPKKLFKVKEDSEHDSNYYIEIIDKNREIFDKAYNEFNLEYYFKSYGNEKVIDSIFNDQTYLNISEKRYDKVYLELDEEDEYNYISLNKKHMNAKNFNEMLGSVKGAVSYLIEGIKILAINYYQTAREKGDFDIQEAVMQVLDMFGLNNYRMVSRVMLSITGSTVKKNISNDMFDIDFYTTGFRFYEFSEHKVSDLETNIEFYELKETPEQFLMTLASKAYVVGLSATGTLTTVLGNYNLKYIESKIGDRLYKPSKDDVDRSNKHIDSRLNINKSNTTIIPVCSDSKTINSFFNDEEFGISLNGAIDKCLDDNKEYLKLKLINVLLSIHSFIKSDNKALLILTNRNVQKGNSVYSEKTFNEYFKLIGYENNVDNIKYYYIDSKNFDDKKKEYKQALSEGYRVILISSYQTVGVGQNLQYEIDGKKLDIDSLYLENPTNLIVDANKFDKNSYSELMKYIYQIESLKENGELLFNEANNSIISGFYKKYKILKPIENKIYDSESLQYYSISLLIQAVGRICRTNEVVQNKTIYVDNDIFIKVDLSKVADKKLNYEFKAIIDKQTELSILERKVERDNNIVIAQNNNRAISSKLRYEVSNGWTEEKKIWWEEFRVFVLKHPTISDEELDKYPQFKNMYVHFSSKSNSYYFNHENDWEDVDLSLDKGSLKDEMSSTDSRLNTLLLNKIIKDYFIDNGYCTEFESNQNLLLPAVYNNIYKGALGEIVGEYVLKHFDINISHITELNQFEKFDYKLNDIYFDFKLWKNSGNDLDYEHIENKLEKVNGKYAVIINVLGDSKMIISDSNNICTIPALIDVNTGEISKKAIDKIHCIIGGIK
ncbi:MAG: hypothetical protein IJS83_00140 [Acholeplasmatales bacterium]|nr:hypothetical protein [Acholeplasmatales bacterium]